MKKLVFYSILLFTTFVSACEKCMVCQTTSNNTGAVIDSYPEICGRKATLDAQELTYRLNLPDSLELTCPRDQFMKNTLKIFSLLLSLGYFSSCKKCTTCEVKDGSGNVVSAAEETCGNASQIEDAKDISNTRAIIIGGTSTCTDD